MSEVYDFIIAKILEYKDDGKTELLERTKQIQRYKRIKKKIIKKMEEAGINSSNIKVGKTEQAWWEFLSKNPEKNNY
jgi:diphthamide synthase subunit DPH2